MMTEHQLNRAQAIENYGQKCYLCAHGPLTRRGLFILPVGPVSCHVPLCKECRDHLKAGATVKAIVQKLRRRANTLLIVTRQRATSGGFRIAAVPEDWLSPRD